MTETRTLVLNTGYDGYVSSGSTGTTYDSSVMWYIGDYPTTAVYRYFAKPDLAELLNIPEGDITSAKYYVYNDSTYYDVPHHFISTTITLYPTTSAMPEHVTWANQPGLGSAIDSYVIPSGTGDPYQAR